MNRLGRMGLVLFSVLCMHSARADEGMWLFNRLPLERLEKQHGFKPSKDWARHVMRSCVRISSGGSGSFVSGDGLILTNHHVASTFIQELSTAEHNYMEDGFFARTREQELKCPNAEILVLWEIEDVTAKVQENVRDDMDPGAAELARRAAIAAIEKASKEKTGLHSEVVTLYRGGEFQLYRYRRYDDVRLVMAPEVKIAFFGGDTDNFEFPRYCLDMTFLRVYEDGKPAKIDHFLKWSAKGVSDGDLTFVAGNPGRTERLNTVDHLRFYRDHSYPGILSLLYRREVALQQFSLRGAEAKRVARDDLFSIQNSRKALRGILGGLLDPQLMRRKIDAEASLRGFVGTGKAGASQADWDNIASAIDSLDAFYAEYGYLERARAFWSDVYRKAAGIVRLVEEIEKPNSERLPSFRDSVLPRFKQRLLSAAPIDADLEVAKLTDSLTDFAHVFGAEHSLVQSLLAGKSPADRAFELVSGTKLFDVAERRKLIEGGREAVAKSDDPMIALALSVDPYARAVKTKFENLYQGVQTKAYGNISKAAFAMTGTSVYPDATFTLRLAYGVVKGWKEGNKSIPAFTKLGGTFDRFEENSGQDPYELPKRWLAARDRVRKNVPFNFVSTADIIGGNSGSPVIDRSGELVGLIFDGNIHGLILDVVYTEEKARAVSVDARAIIATLSDFYAMESLVKEITGR